MTEELLTGTLSLNTTNQHYSLQYTFNVCSRIDVFLSISYFKLGPVAPARQHSFVEIGHEIMSKAILSLPLIPVGKLSVTRKRMCTKYWLIA